MLPIDRVLIGGAGLGRLLRLLFRLAVWHAIFHLARGFMVRYTHIPWLASAIILVLVIVLVRFAVVRWRRT
jgi:hypothetical protein